MNWLTKLLPPRIQKDGSGGHKKSIPEGLWVKCDDCESVLYRADLEGNLLVCPKCSYHFRMSVRARLAALLDEENRIELAQDIVPADKLKFRDSRRYTDRLTEARNQSGEKEALIAFSGLIHQQPVVACGFEFNFMAGSMGSATGERFVRAAQTAVELDAAFICFSASGGARMQEGLFSLMQMSKTTAILRRLSEKNIPFISVLTDPTMGGVSASFAFMGDVVLAEPGALIGFAGPRVIEQTVRETLPEGFQRAEFLLEKGALDGIVDRRDMRLRLARLIALLRKQPHPGERTPTLV